ncbi:PD-(D/E)XK motif protein [Kribbella sp. NBC_00889]|uniref:PD-(D/E)XK motif protein n=1 Tax=Kribbella sp. NBC_00889 TaxID=2975974 RepID=UPI00386AAE91|nr:PD-(D/E)XK motif protein [Kribbella sp. NBC_00889]
MEHPIAGQPLVSLFIDPNRSEIGLRAPAGPGEEPHDTGLEHVFVRAVHRPEGRHLEVVVADQQLFVDSYAVLCAVADRIQLQGLNLTRALADTLRVLGRLLQRSESLTTEAELGLLGEVLLLLGLERGGVDVAEALAGWRGPAGEEHDFGLRGIDIEVKTTNAERRSHWISSLTQLVPTDSRPLWLVSHQLTKAGPDDGFLLSDLIQAGRDATGTAAARDRLELCLHQAGWRDVYVRTCRNRWRQRTDSIALAITDDFPRITPSLLNSAGVDLMHLPEVRYRVDLTGRGLEQPVPHFLAAALAQGGTDD